MNNNEIPKGTKGVLEDFTVDLVINLAVQKYLRQTAAFKKAKELRAKLISVQGQEGLPQLRADLIQGISSLVQERMKDGNSKGTAEVEGEMMVIDGVIRSIEQFLEHGEPWEDEEVDPVILLDNYKERIASSLTNLREGTFDQDMKRASEVRKRIAAAVRSKIEKLDLEDLGKGTEEPKEIL